MVRIRSASLPKGTYVKLQPHTTDFINISNPKARLCLATSAFAAGIVWQWHRKHVGSALLCRTRPLLKIFRQLLQLRMHHGSCLPLMLEPPSVLPLWSRLIGGPVLLFLDRVRASPRPALNPCRLCWRRRCEGTAA